MEKNKNLKKLISKRPSTWKKDADYITKNPWLDYSSQIARRVLAIMKKENITQAELAIMVNAKRQQINRILKGQENLTVKTIYNLSKALNTELITFPEYEWNNKKASLTLDHEKEKLISKRAKIVSLKKYLPKTSKSTALLSIK